MALSPDIETCAAFDELNAHPEQKSVRFGRAWEMTRDGDIWTLYHYGTRILTADECSGRTDMHGGFSRSDCDKMNGLCRLLYGCARYRLKDGVLTED